MRITVEFEDDTCRVFENATGIHDSIEDGHVTVHTFDPHTRRGCVENLPLSDVAAWTEENA